MSSLALGKLIGTGAYGSVYQGRWEGRKVAFKKYFISQDEVSQAADIRHEVESLYRLTDHHLIQLYGTTYHQDHLVLVMHFAEGGSLQQAIDTRQLEKADWTAKMRIAQEMVHGLAFLHLKGVLHRDLRSTNVLLTRHLEVKLTDFGLVAAKTKSALHSSSSSSSLSKGSSLRWMAPELFSARPKYSTKSDLYSLGMVMWEVADNCTVPFKDHPDTSTVVALVKSGEREVLPNDTPADYRKWVEHCWRQEPEKRLEAKDMLPKEDGDNYDGSEDAADEIGEDHGKLRDSWTYGRTLVILPLASESNTEKMSKVACDPPPSLADTLLAKAEIGDKEAQMTLAAMYEKGDGVDQDDSKAFSWYKRAAIWEFPEAQWKVGEFLHHGRGVTKDDTQAISWMRLAAHKGHSRAQADLGWMFQNGFGVEKNDSMAVLWYRKSANQGNPLGQTRLGWMYQKGLGVERNYDMALFWYREAAEQGDADGQQSVGFMYHNGKGVEKDYGEALKWYLKSQAQGNTTAQKNIGYMYQYGTGVNQDYSTALMWYHKAAEQGSAQAQNRIGYMYQNGLGVEQDDSMAVFWYRKSAEQGHAPGQNSLGCMYHKGLGVKQDYIEALQWYRKSWAQDHPPAKKNIDLMLTLSRWV